MKKLILLCVTFTFLHAFAVGRDEQNMTEKMEAIVKQSGIKRSHLGLLAVNSEGEEIYALNSKTKMIPASITKLVTAAAVLETFQPAYQFKTQILYDTKGNIYLKGGGDPVFVSEKMWMLVNDFLRAGIKKVSGNIIVDESYFDGEKIDPGREDDPSDRAYNAPISALSFNWNSTTIYIRPGANSGDKAQVWIDPENEYVILKNKVATASKGNDLKAEREFVDGHDVVTVTGKIAVGSEEKHIFKNITEPSLYAGYNLKSFLKQRGVVVAGQVIKGVTPSSAKLASEVMSDRLYQIVTSMDKFSNNFIAEMLSKGLAAQLTGQQGKMDVGLEKIREFLKTELGFKSSDFHLENVSGFTRKNQFTPSQFIQLLDWVKKNFYIAPEFIHSLPIAGVDGTLEKRFKGSMGERVVRAKTGLLNGVVALSGYVGRKQGQQILFCFMFNGNENEAHVREIFDRLATQLAK